MVNTKNFRSIPWINNEIKKPMRKRNILWQHLKHNNASTAADRIQYAAMRNQVVALLRDSKQYAIAFWETQQLNHKAILENNENIKQKNLY